MQRTFWLSDLPREVVAGISATTVTLPVCLSAGLLAYAPFGPEFSARGAAAGLLGAIAGGFFAALAARSSFIVSSPRASIALVQAGLATALLAHQPFAGDFALDILAMAICLVLAGLWQMAFGIFGVGHIIKFTPHPVLAGFVNGIAVLIALSAFRILLRGAATNSGVLGVLAFAAGLTALILYIERKTKRLPASIVGLVVGTGAFYVIGALMPDLPLGPTVGNLTIDVTAIMRTAVSGAETYAALDAEAPQILLTSLVIAVVAAIESLLAARVARNLVALPSNPARFLVAQGIGNAAAGVLGGLPVAAGPSQTITNFRAGGRTRLSGLTSASLLFLIVVFMPSLLAAIPLVVLCAILFTSSILVFDRWSVRLLRDALVRRTREDRGSRWKNLAVIGGVMAVTASVSVIAGVLTGIVLSCVIFIIDMGRPLVRRRDRGDAVFSRRIRPERDAEILRRSGRCRAILHLQGVMFFGNADDLCAEIEDLMSEVDVVALDFRRVADIDISAVGALQHAVSKAVAQKRTLLFCNVPPPHRGVFETFAGAESGREGTLFADLDAALEWMEEKALREEGRSEFEELPLDQIEFLHGLDAGEIQVLGNYLMPMSFPAGTALCHEGEEADYLWILSSGSVSVWLGDRGGPTSRRIAALARGTIVGEMSLLESGARSATVFADEDVTGYMIDRETFGSVLREHPQIAATLLANIAREMARRLGNTSRAFGAEIG